MNKSTKVSTKDPEIKDLDLTLVDKENDMETLQIEPKLESKTKDLEEKIQKLYGSCEKSLDVGLDSPQNNMAKEKGVSRPPNSTKRTQKTILSPTKPNIHSPFKTVLKTTRKYTERQQDIHQAQIIVL